MRESRREKRASARRSRRESARLCVEGLASHEHADEEAAFADYAETLGPRPYRRRTLDPCEVSRRFVQSTNMLHARRVRLTSVEDVLRSLG